VIATAARPGRQPKTRSVPPHPGLIVIAVVLAAAGCGGHRNDLKAATQCLRDNHARPHPPPAPLSNPLRESGWHAQTFAVGSNDLILIAGSNEEAAGRIHRRLTRAVDAVDPSRPAPQQRGRLVYVWATAPSPANRALVRRCLG
jgi:hypothetical protein